MVAKFFRWLAIRTLDVFTLLTLFAFAVMLAVWAALVLGLL